MICNVRVCHAITLCIINNSTYTWSETYFRQDLFPPYLFFRRQFCAIGIFRQKSISDLDSGSLPRKFDMCIIHVLFDNITHVTCTSFACDRFNWRDGIRYSYITFSTKSPSISPVNFSVDIVASKKVFGKKLKSSLSLFVLSFRGFFNIQQMWYHHFREYFSRK